MDGGQQSDFVVKPLSIEDLDDLCGGRFVQHEGYVGLVQPAHFGFDGADCIFGGF